MSSHGQPRLRWGKVVQWAVPPGLLAVIVAALEAGDAWLPLLPPAVSRNLIECFLRSILISYLSLAVLAPLGLIVSTLRILARRRHGLASPRLARLGLLCGSLVVAMVMVELASAAWLGWVHRMPRLPARFPAPPENAQGLSLVVLGGSSAMGYPYDPILSIGQIVAWRLEQSVPGRSVLLDIRADLARNLEEMHKELAALRRKPDAVIVYSGHNEFLSRFEPHRDAGYSELPIGWFLQRLYSLSLRSPLCRLVYEGVRKKRLSGPPPFLRRHELLDVAMFTHSEYHQIRTDFGRRLEAIVAYCEQIGAVPILVIPPANESGFEPSRTVLPQQPDEAERARLTSEFTRARDLELTDPAESLRRYQALLDVQPEFAEVHFRMGRLLEQQERYPEAQRHYLRARDLDGYPIRCRTDFAQIYRDVAARHGCILIDGPEVLRAKSPHGILDDSLFHDAHHPTLLSHVGLAQAVLDQLAARRVLGMEHGKAQPPIELADCAAHFKIDNTLWAGACRKSSAFYRNLGGARYDRMERHARAERLARAVSDLESGLWSPEQLGIPGVGLSRNGSDLREWWNIDLPVHLSPRQAASPVRKPDALDERAESAVP